MVSRKKAQVSDGMAGSIVGSIVIVVLGVIVLCGTAIQLHRANLQLRSEVSVLEARLADMQRRDIWLLDYCGGTKKIRATVDGTGDARWMEGFTQYTGAMYDKDVHASVAEAWVFTEKKDALMAALLIHERLAEKATIEADRAKSRHNEARQRLDELE